MAERLALNRDVTSKIDILLLVTHALKQKDAAGLGALAYAYHEGDKSMISWLADERPLQHIAEALDNPDSFFARIQSKCATDKQLAIVLAARRYLAAATWGWDKACILAGAFLASSSELPSTTATRPEPHGRGEFPFWVALDKHTPQGKEALRVVSSSLGLPYRQVIWSSFYLESAFTDALTESPWWKAEMEWRLGKTGLTVESAKELWKRAQQPLRKELAAKAEQLRELIQASQAIQREMFEGSGNP